MGLQLGTGRRKAETQLPIFCIVRKPGSYRRVPEAVIANFQESVIESDLELAIVVLAKGQ